MSKAWLATNYDENVYLYIFAETEEKAKRYIVEAGALWGSSYDEILLDREYKLDDLDRPEGYIMDRSKEEDFIPMTRLYICSPTNVKSCYRCCARDVCPAYKNDRKTTRIKWNPYPREKPNESGKYFLALKTPGKPGSYVDDYIYDSEAGGFYEGEQHFDDLVAWAKFPSPYKGDGSPEDEVWTPIKDEAPEDLTMCVTTHERTDSKGNTSRFTGIDDFLYEDLSSGRYFAFDDTEVVAWMYYPEPYEE